MEKGARWDFCDVPVCGCAFKPGGSDYRGNLSMTRDGKTCQRWDTNSPHNHGYQPEDYPELVENYCRNPRGVEDPHEFTIWCYTTDPSTRWEYCIDPRCPVHAKNWPYRYDGRCGKDFTVPDSEGEAIPGQCHPCGNKPCCSDFGWCGFSYHHCFCDSCIDYRPTCT
ncbi:plasminogen-like [Branchiostoma floridae x Branchiostoma belcheri]